MTRKARPPDPAFDILRLALSSFPATKAAISLRDCRSMLLGNFGLLPSSTSSRNGTAICAATMRSRNYHSNGSKEEEIPSAWRRRTAHESWSDLDTRPATSGGTGKRYRPDHRDDRLETTAAWRGTRPASPPSLADRPVPPPP